MVAGLVLELRTMSIILIAIVVLLVAGFGFSLLNLLRKPGP